MRTSLRYVLIFVTVAGGCRGIISALRLPFFSDIRGFWNYALLVAFIALYAFVVVCGIMLWRNPRRVTPILIAFAIQLPFISSPLLSYQFAAGPRFDLRVGTPSEPDKIGVFCGMSGQVDSSFRFSMEDEGPSRIGINLVALLFFVLTPAGTGRENTAPGDPQAPTVPSVSG